MKHRDRVLLALNHFHRQLREDESTRLRQENENRWLERQKHLEEAFDTHRRLLTRRLEKLIKRPVKKLDDCVGPDVEKAVAAMKPGDVVMLENVRFHKEEKEDNDLFAAKLAKLGDVMVQDAFAQVHRIHASITGIPRDELRLLRIAVSKTGPVCRQAKGRKDAESQRELFVPLLRHVETGHGDQFGSD